MDQAYNKQVSLLWDYCWIIGVQGTANTEDIKCQKRRRYFLGSGATRDRELHFLSGLLLQQRIRFHDLWRGGICGAI